MANIKGPDVVCPNTVNTEYSSISTPDSKYYWHVLNGKRNDNDFDSRISVNWPDSGLAQISLMLEILF